MEDDPQTASVVVKDEITETQLRKRSIASDAAVNNNNNELVSQPSTEMATPIGKDKEKEKDKGLWRDLVAYWFLGLTNNYGYVVMLTAAHDIIKEITGDDDDDDDENFYNTRPCNIISTGAILLADIIPGLCVKIVSPFLPFYVHIRVACCVILSAAGFIMVAYAKSEWLAIMGVVLTSLASGLGEATFLSYSSIYNRNVISTWSSGTGGAGVVGSTSYAGLTSLGMSPKGTLLLMLVVPAVEAVAFWLCLRHPHKMSYNYNQQPEQPHSQTDSSAQESSENASSTATIVKAKDAETAEDMEKYTDDGTPLITFKEKLNYMPQLLMYAVPLVLVYLFEYFINQGLFELIYYPDIFLNKDSQYRWFQVDYQIGVFISRSSVNLIQIKYVWVMAIFQFLNVFYFLFEVIYFFTPSIWIIFVLILWEGLLGGGAYVNTFYRMSLEISPARRLFAIGVVTLSDSMGIALAGIAAIPSHNALCDLPVPNRLKL